MRFLRANTAVLVTVGPFYDKTDGVTIETALTITNERITLTADTDAGSAPTNILDNIAGATAATANDLNYITGNDAGLMQLELAAADTNRVGRMFLTITDAANHVPVFHEFFVLPQAIYDWLTGVIVPLPANVTTWLGTAAATPTVAGVPEVDLTHVAGATTDVSALATNMAAVLVDTGTTLDGRLPAALVGGRMDSSVGAMAANVLTAAATAADFGVEVAAAIWDALTSGMVTVGSIGKKLADWVIGSSQTGDSFARLGAPAGASVSADIATRASQTSVTTIDDLLDTEVQAIIDALVVIDDFIDTEIGGLVTSVAAIKAKTDALAFTVANQVDANPLSINGSAPAAVQLAAHALGALRLVVDAGSSTTAIVFKTVDGAAPSAVNDFYTGRFIVFTSGALKGQATSITDYVGATVTATVVALTGAPADTVTAIIV
jgi:hypothetical protein